MLNGTRSISVPFPFLIRSLPLFANSVIDENLM